MPVFIGLPIDTDPQDVLNDAYAFMRSVEPGWDPADGELDVWIIQSNASIAAESRDVASRQGRNSYMDFGANLIGIPPLDEAPATTLTTWVMRDNLGYTVPAQTQVGIVKTGEEIIPFWTLQDQVVAPGQTTVTDVLLEALSPGADTSGLGNAGADIAGGQLILLDALEFVSNVTMQEQTTGGVDAESEDDYLNRLTAELQLLTPRPVVARDFAILARGVAGVFRSTAVDNYDPTTNTYDNERMITVFNVDSSGNAVSSPVKQAVSDKLEALRELNFKVWTSDASYTDIDISYIAVARRGADIVATKSAIDSALAGYINPATWGAEEGDARTWDNEPVVRYLEVAQVINEVADVDHIDSLSMGANGGPQGQGDITMFGPAPLPRLSNNLVGSVV